MEHLSDDRIRAFLSGQRGEEESEAVVEHLAGCDDCLRRGDRLWADAPLQGSAGSIPDLEPAAADRLRHSLLGRIRRAELWRQIVLLGTVRMLQMAVALLKPFVGPGPKS